MPKGVTRRRRPRQARDRIRDHLFRQKAQKRYQDYLAELRQKAYIEVKLP